MLKIHKHKNLVWYDFINPQTEELLPIISERKIDNYITKKFLTTTNRDKALVLGKHIFLSIHLPDFSIEDNSYEVQEINFIIGKNFMVTCKKYPSVGMDKFAKTFDKQANLEKKSIKETSIVYPFLHLVEKIYENSIFEMRNIEKDIERISREIFRGQEQKMVIEISKTNRKLIEFRKSIRSHRVTWERFFDLSESFFEEESLHEALEAIKLSYEKVYATAEELKETLWELRDTNNSLLSAKQNETAKNFTVIAFMTLPMTLFLTILSLPTHTRFIIGREGDIFTIIFILFFLFGLMVGVSKYKKWW